MGVELKPALVLGFRSLDLIFLRTLGGLHSPYLLHGFTWTPTIFQADDILPVSWSSVRQVYVLGVISFDLPPSTCTAS
jgi:hypothetical protein